MANIENPVEGLVKNFLPDQDPDWTNPDTRAAFVAYVTELNFCADAAAIYAQRSGAAHGSYAQIRQSMGYPDET